MSLSVAVFSAKGRPEGIDIAESGCKGFGGQLAGNGQAGHLAEEVLAVIHRPVIILRYVGKIQRGQLEHFTGPLRVRTGDQGGVQVYEIALLEEFVNGKSSQGADPEDRLEGIGTGTKMSDGAKIFHAVPFLLQGIVRSRSTQQGHGICVQFERLAGVRGQDQIAADLDRGSYVVMTDLVKVGNAAPFINDLQGTETAAVTEDNEAQGF